MTILRYSKFLSNISLNHLLGAKIQFNPCQTVIVGFLKKDSYSYSFLNLWYVLSFYFIINTSVGMSIILFLAFSSRPVFIGALQISSKLFLIGVSKNQNKMFSHDTSVQKLVYSVTMCVLMRNAEPRNQGSSHCAELWLV